MELQEELRELLLTIPSARISHGGKQINVRCRYCNDSDNPRSAHMYINLGYDDTPLYFHCFKCHASSIINIENLLSWGLYPSTNLYSKLSLHNKSVLTLSKNRAFKDAPVYYLNNRYISDNRLSELKLGYINRRLGLNLSYQDILDNKIVLNLNDLLSSNNITNITKKDYIVQQLSESFIGFITEDNAFLNMRNLRRGKVDKYIDSKYTMYSIFGKFDNTRAHYTIPTDINLYDINRTKIHIGEGVFDILSVYYNLRKEKKNNIYSAIGGNNYVNLMKHFILILKLINIEFHVYIDNDVLDYKISDMSNLCRDFNIPLYLHRNMFSGEKDFGTSLNKINEQIQKLV